MTINFLLIKFSYLNYDYIKQIFIVCVRKTKIFAFEDYIN